MSVSLPCTPPGGLLDPGIKSVSLTSPSLAGRFFTTSATWETPRKWQPAPVFLLWDIPWTEEPGRLQSMGSQTVRQDWEIEHATDLNLLFKPVCLHSCASSYPGSWSLHALSVYYKEVLPSLLAVLVLLPQFMSTWSDGLIYPFQNLTVLAGKIWLPGWTYDQAISLNSPFLYSTSSYLKKKKCTYRKVISTKHFTSITK